MSSDGNEPLDSCVRMHRSPHAGSVTGFAWIVVDPPTPCPVRS